MASGSFTFKGEVHKWTSETVDTDYGPEVKVDIFDAKGEKVGHSQEAASASTQVGWWKESMVEAENYAQDEAAQVQSAKWILQGLCETCGGSGPFVVEQICEACMDKYCEAMYKKV